ncbi:MAG: hypothetical protein ABI165_12160 [Bryobacteraceae bacterium]
MERRKLPNTAQNSNTTGDFAGAVRALLDAGAALPPHAEELEPSDAVLELLP